MVKRKKSKSGKVALRNEKEIDGMRKTCHVARDILIELKDFLKEGISTKAVDDYAGKIIKSKGCRSAFLGYRGFPGNICISINEEVVHGIGNEKKIIKDGDIVKIDVGIKKDGWIGDNALTVPIGNISDENKKLLHVTENSLYEAIKQAYEGNHLGSLCHAVENYVTQYDCSVVRDLVGHGVGRRLHEEPPVPNYGTPDTGLILYEGMILAIEPMINLGTYKVKTLADRWTIVTLDNKYSSHFEHTVVVRKNEGEILTPRDRITDSSYIS